MVDLLLSKFVHPVRIPALVPHQAKPLTKIDAQRSFVQVTCMVQFGQSVRKITVFFVSTEARQKILT